MPRRNISTRNINANQLTEKPLRLRLRLPHSFAFASVGSLISSGDELGEDSFRFFSNQSRSKLTSRGAKGGHSHRINDQRSERETERSTNEKRRQSFWRFVEQREMKSFVGRKTRVDVEEKWSVDFFTRQTFLFESTEKFRLMLEKSFRRTTDASKEKFASSTSKHSFPPRPSTPPGFEHRSIGPKDDERSVSTGDERWTPSVELHVRSPGKSLSLPERRFVSPIDRSLIFSSTTTNPRLRIEEMCRSKQMNQFIEEFLLQSIEKNKQFSSRFELMKIFNSTLSDYFREFFKDILFTSSSSPSIRLLNEFHLIEDFHQSIRFVCQTFVEKEKDFHWQKTFRRHSFLFLLSFYFIWKD